jgi:trehalose-phosphatase
MKVLDRQVPYSFFLDRLQTAPQRILLLDYDGTLAPFTRDRNRAFPYPGVPELLSEIMNHDTRLVLISGRPARELVMLSGTYPHPEIWGSHGLERLLPDGSHNVRELPAEEGAALLSAADAMRREGLEPHLEIKPGSVALHWRGMGLAEIEDLRSRALGLWRPLLDKNSLELLEFDGGIEVRTRRANKGDAVARILREAAAEAAVAYLGDDQTDEDAFRALKGRGLTILVRPEPRSTEAEIWLKPPEELTEFLRQWLIACGGEA